MVGSQGFPIGKSAPFSWLAARRATPPPGTGEKSSDGEDEGKRHAPSQLNVQEFHRGRREGGGPTGISLRLFGSPHSINLLLLVKPVSGETEPRAEFSEIVLKNQSPGP